MVNFEGQEFSCKLTGFLTHKICVLGFFHDCTFIIEWFEMNWQFSMLKLNPLKIHGQTDKPAHFISNFRILRKWWCRHSSLVPKTSYVTYASACCLIVIININWVNMKLWFIEILLYEIQHFNFFFCFSSVQLIIN